MPPTSSPSPRVSVVMPLFNSEAHVREAVESVLAQDYRDLELVVVDDASSDGSLDILREMAAADGRIVVVRHDRNRGISEALNSGLRVARGEYVARLDSDDIALPGRLCAQVVALDDDPLAVLVSCAFEVFDDHSGRRIRLYRMANDPVVVRWLLLFTNAVGGHGQVMFRRIPVLELGGYSPDRALVSDYDLWTRLVERGRFINLPMVGMRYRVHDRNASHTHRKEQLFDAQCVMEEQLSRYLGRELSPDELLAMLHLWHGRLRPRMGSLAARVTREVYDRFSRDVQAQTRSAIRATIATRFVLLSILCLRHGRVIDAADHAVRAAFWHPLGFVHALRTVSELARFALGRRLSGGWRSDAAKQVKARFMHRSD